MSSIPSKKNLLNFAKDSNPRIRAAALHDLGLMVDPANAPIFLAALDDTTWQVRIEAIDALAKIGSPMAIQAIQPLLEDPEVEVRQSSREAIKRLRGRSRGADFFLSQDGRKASSPHALSWPSWMAKIELWFAIIASLFNLTSTIRFLTIQVWAEREAGAVLWGVMFLMLMLAMFLVVFLVSGFFQAGPRIRDLATLVKERPWRRLVEIVFIADVVGFFVSGFVGEIIFLVGLSAGVPLAIAFFISEIWTAAKKTP